MSKVTQYVPVAIPLPPGSIIHVADPRPGTLFNADIQEVLALVRYFPVIEVAENEKAEEVIEKALCDYEDIDLDPGTKERKGEESHIEAYLARAWNGMPTVIHGYDVEALVLPYEIEEEQE